MSCQDSGKYRYRFSEDELNRGHFLNSGKHDSSFMCQTDILLKIGILKKEISQKCLLLEFEEQKFLCINYKICQ